MIDNGGRLKGTHIDSIARTFHALTYSYPDFDVTKDLGPRINIIFTNVSKYFEVEDDEMTPGHEAVAKDKGSPADHFKDLIDSFRKDLAQRIYADLGRKQPLD